MLKRDYRILCMVLCVSLLLAWRCPFALAKRATQEEMDKATKPLDEYLGDILKNYLSVESLILKRAKLPWDEVSERFKESLSTCRNNRERAVYHYLLARSCFWQGYHEFKSTRDKAVFDRLRSPMISEHLQAYELSNAIDGPLENAQDIRLKIADTLLSALATNIWGSGLSDEEKRSVVERFVVPWERTIANGKLRPVRKTQSDAYRNLGVESRLASELPKQLPSREDDLWKLFEEWKNALGLEQLKPLLDAIENHPKSSRLDHAVNLAMLGNAYKEGGQEDMAVKWYARAAEKESRFYRKLYLISALSEDKARRAKSNEYFDKYIAAGQPGNKYCPSSKYTKERAYARAIRGLVEAESYEEGLIIIERFEKGEDFQKGVGIVAGIILNKATCMRKLGKKDKAIETYRLFLSKTEGQSKYARQRSFAERTMEKLIKEKARGGH